MKLLLITDAWEPQINGVVTCYQHVIRELENAGHVVHTIHPGLFPSMPCPFYKSIPLAWVTQSAFIGKVENFQPEAIHIATEGPVGMAGRKWCRKYGFRFTSSYHTQFPRYLKSYTGIPESFTFAAIRRFHAASEKVLVPSQSVSEELIRQGIQHTWVWTRGVDHDQFYPGESSVFRDLPGPIMIYCGRVAREKNIEAFLRSDHPGTKVVIGDGPAFASLRQQFPDVVWTGFKRGKDLADCYRAGDVFVFPSKTDTFGVVMLEAMACGLPVAAYPVTGPIDVIRDPKVGTLDHNLTAAISQSLTLNRSDCVSYAKTFTWKKTANLFSEQLVRKQCEKPAVTRANFCKGFISDLVNPN